jgi:hypothetical protein
VEAGLEVVLLKMETKVAPSEPVEGNIRRPGFVMGNSASINNNNNNNNNIAQWKLPTFRKCDKVD